MSNAHDRRAPGTSRIPFDAMVEVGGALGPSFEAQAVNLSEEGMSLRTAYLPEVGQPVMCRFDAGQGMAVVAAGEVLWQEDMGNGGEFGIRFTNVDGASTVALQRILGMAEEGQAPMPETGRKVRLHIDGLASPMRARIKDQMASGVTAYSELGFLQMGKALELEDAASGERRPASIDRVEVEVDASSRIPQLVVSLRYDNASTLEASSLGGIEVPTHAAEPETMDHENESEHEAPMAEAQAPAMATAQTEEPKAADTGMDEESNKLKSAFARNAAKVTPALVAWATRAKVAAAMLAARARRGSHTGEDVEIPMRRTTAPAPGGGLHASGRKVVRGSIPDDQPLETTTTKTSRFTMTKKKAAIAGTIGIASVLVFFALRKPAPAPQLANAPPADTAAAAPETTTPATTAAAMTTPTPNASPMAPPSDPLATAAAAMTPGKGGKATPFTNGPVGAHPTIIKIKMDGPVEGIQGATQPTGFTIVTPNRKAADPAASLASKDPRLEAVRIANEAGGAELNVTFKEGVPNYVVRAHGDTLEMVLAKPTGPGKAEASSGTSSKKGKKKHH